MAFPAGPGAMPAGVMNPNAGMSEQEQQMVKAMQMGMESCLGKTVMAGVMGGGLGAMFGLFMSSMRYDTPMSQPLAVNVTPKPSTTTTTTATAATASTATSASLKPPVLAPTIASSTVISTPVSASIASAPATTTLSSSAPTLPSAAASVPLTDLPLRQQLKHGLRDMYRSSLSSGKNFAKVGALFSGTECAIEGLRAKNDLYNGVAGGCLTGGILARNAGPQAVAVGCVGFAAFSAAIDAYMRMPEDERSKPIA